MGRQRKKLLSARVKQFLQERSPFTVREALTNFRALEALPLLKQQFGLSIVTSNTATLEAILSVEKRIRPGQPEVAKR